MKGARGRGTLEKEKPPIFGMIQRGGEVVIQMLSDVKQKTIKPIIEDFVSKGSKVHTDEYDIYSNLNEWGYNRHSVCHSKGEYARDDDGDGFHEIHVNRGWATIAFVRGQLCCKTLFYLLKNRVIFSGI